jgi:type IV secretion system protein VirB11
MTMVKTLSAANTSSPEADGEGGMAPGLNKEAGVYLKAFLAPLEPWLARADVSEILINQPEEVWIERNGVQTMERHSVPELSAQALNRLAAQIARANNQGISRAHPLLSGLLPGGERVQIVAPPATRKHLAIAIRKQVTLDLSLADYRQSGAFEHVKTQEEAELSQKDAQLLGLLQAQDFQTFFEQAVRARKNILISGGTSSGKTTFLNALLKNIADYERVIAIEDTPEVVLSVQNAVGLVSVRGELGETQVTTEELLQAALRMRPDRLLLGEIRGSEAFSFLRAVNTGHPGSITTVHADSPKGAIEQVALMALQARMNLNRSEIMAYVRSVVDIIVQVRRHQGRRIVSDILFDPKSSTL